MATSPSLLRSQIQAAFPRLDLPLAFVPRPVPPGLPLGIPELSALSETGIPRGEMTEIAGDLSSGRTTLLYSLLAQASLQQEYCALIDAHDAFDPAGAARAGAHLARLLWIRCGGNAENALKAADRLAHAGGFGLVIFDLADVDVLTARRISLASWFRLRQAVEKTPTALVVLGRQFNARSCSRLQLEMRRSDASWSPHLLRSVRFEAETRKHQRARGAGFTAGYFDRLA